MSTRSTLVGEMSDSDAVLWTVGRDPVLRSPIVAVMLLDEEPDWEVGLDRVERLTVIEPRLRARAVARPYGLGNPQWVDDGRFDLAHHVHQVGAPHPGTFRGVLDLAQLMGMTAFDPELPLWEAVQVGGLDDGRAALIIKIHHSVVDGIAGVGLLLHLLDLERHPAKPAGRAQPGPTETELSSTEPVPGPITGESHRPWLSGRLSSLTRSAIGRAGGVAHLFETAVHSALRPVASFGTLETDTLSLARLLAPAPTPLSPILRGRGIGRHFDTIDLNVGTIHDVAHSLGCTMNDVFVAGVLGGVRRYHLLHGSKVEHLRALVPISIRSATDANGGNQFVPVRFVLDADISDPRKRVHHVQEVMNEWKHNPALELTNAVTSVLSRLPPALTTLLFGSMLKGGDFVATDIPGAPFDTYLAGAQVIGLYAFAPPSGAAVNVAMVTSAGHECIGINLDTVAVADCDAMVECIRAGFEEVLATGRIEMAKTHDSNKVAGIYACDDCGERITMPIGHEFPPCPGCGKAVTYTLAVPTK